MPLFKAVFKFITDQFALFDNAIYNYVIMVVIGFIAFIVAIKIVGEFYTSGEISGSMAGSFLHWVIRLIVFALLFSLAAFIIWIIRLILLIPLWLWITLCTVIFGVLIYIYIRKRYLFKNPKL